MTTSSALALHSRPTQISTRGVGNEIVIVDIPCSRYPAPLADLRDECSQAFDRSSGSGVLHLDEDIFSDPRPETLIDDLVQDLCDRGRDGWVAYPDARGLSITLAPVDRFPAGRPQDQLAGSGQR